MNNDDPANEHAEHEHGHHVHEHAGVRETNDLAIVGVITAILFWPVGLVISLIARREAKARGESGEGLALVGVLIAALAGLFWTILFAALLAGGLGMNGGPFRGRGEFGFMRQGTIMKVAPGFGAKTPCNAPATGTSGGCTNGGYVNPGGPMIPAPSSGGSASSGGISTGPAWSGTISGSGVGSASVGALSGSSS